MILVSRTKYFVKVGIKALLNLKMEEEEKEGKRRRTCLMEEKTNKGKKKNYVSGGICVILARDWKNLLQNGYKQLKYETRLKTISQ